MGLKPSAAADPDTCTASVTIKVKHFNEYRPYNSCPSAKEVGVSYEMYLSPGETEVVTLTAMVPFGGSHEFTCAGAVLKNGATLASVAVYAQAYDGTISSCTLLPIEEGVFQQSFNNKLADGGELVIHEHPETGGFISTITNSSDAARTVKSDTSDSELVPTADPEFAAKR